jgi:hypothetical protein
LPDFTEIETRIRNDELCDGIGDDAVFHLDRHVLLPGFTNDFVFEVGRDVHREKSQFV